MKSVFLFMIVIYNLLTIKATKGLSNNRDKRNIIFPRGNPTRLQFVAGVGIPVDLEAESVTIGYVFKAQYYLPYNATDLRPLWTKRSTRKRRQMDDIGANYNFDLISNSNHEFNYVESEDDMKQKSNMRWNLYETFEQGISRFGSNGRSCVLRLICEAAAIPFTYSNGILGELMHVILSPSTTNEKQSQNADNEYLIAETNGKNKEQCDRIYNKCDRSILQFFTKIF